MENRKRLALAFCSVTLGASLCAFAGNAPGTTLNTALQVAGASPGAWHQCDQAGHDAGYSIFALATGIDGQGSVVCSGSDFTGNTTHTSCSGAVKASASVYEQAPAPASSLFLMCSATGNSGNGGKCSVGLFATQLTNPQHTCSVGSFTAIGAISN
jgi:hypothetical protein